jgi:hypothetical protein
MNKEAWLLDEDVLLKGVVKRKWLRRIFVPNSFGCGFGYQYVHKKDIGKILFRNDFHIVYAGLGHLERVYTEKPMIVDEINAIKQVNERNGICPHCGRNISFGCSTDSCYWCRNPIVWNK